jgi:arylsulfatase A-like enzyme
MFDAADLKAPPTMFKPAEGLPSWGRKQRAKFSGALIARYFGMVKCIDDNVGKILGALRRAGVLDRTLVVFTADHGDLCGEHGRDNKGVPYEGSARIPFVLYCPGKVRPGTVVTQALSCVDFLPTVIRLMGFQTAGREEGRDASALFTGRAPADRKDVVFLRGAGRTGANWLAAVTSRYKLVFSPRDEPWLFDLGKDPDELRNFLRVPDCREVVRRLSRELLAYCKKHRDPYGEAPRIKADLTWAIEGTGPYAAPAGLPAETPAGRRKARQRRRAAPKG